MTVITNIVKITCSRLFHTNVANSAGHSKWANIKHTKALKDSQKSIQFTKLGRQIRLAVQSGDSANPEINTSLRSAIDEALKKNMPQSSISNILKKFGDKNAQQLNKYSLEIQLLPRIFIICVLYTDNFPAVKMNITGLLKKFNGIITNTQHLFDKSGMIVAVAPDNYTKRTDLEDICTEDAILCGADDVHVIDNANKRINFLCDPNNIESTRNELEQRGYLIEYAEQILTPKIPIQMNENDVKKFLLFKEKLLLIDGVEDIFDNVDEN